MVSPLLPFLHRGNRRGVPTACGEWSLARPALLLVLLSVCAGCSGGGYARWDGRRGYDGNGDYGYDLTASRAEARSYRSRAAVSYPVPGTRDDPWGPYIREAATRFAVPERWIREVMRQESSFRLYESDGSLITSSAGAMGLMQVMPGTYDMLRRRYGLGSDPYEPRDNILAGTAYIREMYDRYGAPAFLAAYNAGPERVESYLAGSGWLPDETVNYLSRVAPRLGTEVAMTGPLAAYAGGATVATASTRRRNGGTDADRAYAGGGMVGQQYATLSPDPDRAYAGGGVVGQQYGAFAQPAAIDDDPASRAFDGGGLVTRDAPTGVLTAPGGWQGVATDRPPSRIYESASLAAPAVPQESMRPPAQPMAMLMPVAAAATRPGGWGIQVGAYPDATNSRAALAAARARGGTMLAGAQPSITVVERGGTLYRARLLGLSAEDASTACARLLRAGMDCFTVPPGS